MSQQREIIYKQRAEVLESDNLREIVETMIICHYANGCRCSHADEEFKKIGIYRSYSLINATSNFPSGSQLTVKESRGLDKEEIIEFCSEHESKRYDEKEAGV